MKKKIAIILSLAIIVSAGFVFSSMTSKANGAGISIGAPAEAVTKGQEFTVTLSLNSDINIATLDCFVDYDPEVLEIVPSEDGSVAGASGMVHIMDAFEDGAMEAVYELQFVALEVGNSDISLRDIYIEEFETLNILEAVDSSAAITVIEDTTQSTEARLADLLVFPGELNVEFNANTFEYSIELGAEEENIVISAVPMEEDSIVTVDKDETLSVGANTISITVTAPSGASNTYILTVNRGPLADDILTDSQESEDEIEVQSADPESTDITGDTEETGEVIAE